MASILNNDLFCIERGGKSYKWTGAELNLQIQGVAPIANVTADLPIEIDVTDRIVTISIRDGTLDEKGAVQLTNIVNTSETLALTPKGAKDELDKKANLTGNNATGTWPISITGNAATATSTTDSINSQKIYVKRDDESNENRYLTFVNSSTVENKDLYMDSGLSYNPLSNVLTTSVFKGSLRGRADVANEADRAREADTATNSINVDVINDGTNASRYLTFASRPSGNDRIRTDGGLRYNPFNNIFSTTNIELTGNFESSTVTTNNATVNNSLSVKTITANSAELSGEIKAKSAKITNGISASSVSLSGNLSSNNINTGNIVATDIGARNVTLSSKIKSASAEITGSISVGSTVTASTGNFRGNISASNGNFGGNVSGANISASNKLSGRDAELTNHLQAKSANINDKITTTTIQASSGNIDNNLTAGSVGMSSFQAGTGTVINNLNVGSISGGSATFSGKLTAASAQINGEIKASIATVNGPLSASSASITNGITAGSGVIGNVTLSSSNVSAPGSVSVTYDINAGRDVNCTNQVTAKTLHSTADTYVNGNLIVRTGGDHRAVIYSNGSAYFSNEKIRFDTSGNGYFVNLNTSNDMNARLFRSSYANQSNISGAMAFRVNNGSDNYIRFCSNTGAIRGFLNVPTRTGGNASGTWPINITGNASFATNSTNAVNATNATNATTSQQVTINYSNNSNSTYQMLWGSGNRIYGTSQIYCNPGTDYLYSGAFYCGNWFRSSGNSGWYSESHGGGIYMQDSTWVRVYNGKAFYVANQIAATGDVTAFYSDSRLKTHFGNIEGALDKVCSLNGFYYKHNEIAKSYGYESEEMMVGVSAQEVKEVLPEVVTRAPFDIETDPETGELSSKTGEDYMTVKYEKIVPLLIEAIKELKSEIQELKGVK